MRSITMNEELPPWEDLLNEYRAGPDRLFSVAEGLSDQELALAPDKNSWSVRQIIHHLSDGAIIWGMFIRQALGGQGGEFNLHWYWEKTQDEWAEHWKYSGRDIRPTLDLYRANIENLSSLLAAVAEPWNYTLKIFWPEGEEYNATVADSIQIQAVHLAQHLEDMQRILAGKKD
jgi:hypothetical protein